MITYCPSCNTHFRVHAEQLAARGGQVRCGKCNRVFDALEHLIEEAAAQRAPRLQAEVAAAEPAPASTERESPQFGAAAPEATSAQTAILVADAPEPRVQTPETAALEPPISEPAKAEPAVNTFDFGPGAGVKAAAHVRRWPWLAGALLLLLTVLGQAAYHYRSAIILLFPEAKPYAAALCASLGCELPLPRRVELMSIEASDLQADTTNPNVMVLSATLKNRAIFNQQHPLLELTLTDAQDQPLVRRVLAPQDYLGKGANIQVGFAANTEIAVKVFIESSQVKATGYRLYLFYP